MTLTNRDVFVIDPTKKDIPNLGVAKVKNPENDGDWETLQWELQSFVCEGEYERGLERILSQFLSHLSQAEQPAAWVSGFFGSGKSHLMRVLEYLWRDYELPSGASARSLTELPSEIQTHLTELSIAGKRAGGLWSAAGTLGAGASGSVRLAFLAVIFDAAGLPQEYAPARLAIWLRKEALYDKVQASVEKAGKALAYELRNLYVSPVLAQALIDAGASFGSNPAEVSAALLAQFPDVSDISTDQMLTSFEDVLTLQTKTEGKLPLTLVVLDEMQQYINDDNDKAFAVQDLVEGCSSKFGSQVLVVATGQAALTANPTLQKLIDRFSVTVALSDTDVETVVRKVVLRKKPDKVAEIEATLAKVSGEISMHLKGTKLGWVGTDQGDLVADYPLLPTRRRFWERALRAIDKAGKAGVLRTQLKIVHEAARSVADQPLGTVITGDFVFMSESASMLASGVLLREIDELIRGLQDGSPDGELKSRACALIFLISQLPHDGVGDTGLRATAPVIADLLVADLAVDGPGLRRDIPALLDDLVEHGRVMKLGEEFHLQTEEGADWTRDFNQRRAALGSDAARISSLRAEWLIRHVDKELEGIKLMHGASKTPRKFDRHWGDDEPTSTTGAIPVWIRDEWNISEGKVKNDAAAVGNESPMVYVLLPKLDAEAVRDTLLTYAAANDTISQRSEPHTDQGRQAKQGMASRVRESEDRLNVLFGAVIAHARIFQGGGNELTGSSLRQGVETAGQHALTRLFPKFGPADNPNWSKVIDKARDGAPDALGVVGWTGDVAANPVCKEVLSRTPAAGFRGSELQRQLGEPQYGWPQDAINGAILALLANGNIRADRDGQPVANPKELAATQIGKTTFAKEDEPPTMQERLLVRGVLTAASVVFVTGQEQASIGGLIQHLIELAQRAGGPAPLPAPPDDDYIKAFLGLGGNQQFRAVAEAAETLRQDITLWTAASKQSGSRETALAKLDRLLAHAAGSSAVGDARAQRAAIHNDRLLLTDPDPAVPLLAAVSAALRADLTELVDAVSDRLAKELAALAASDEWKALDANTQAELLSTAGLTGFTAPDVTNDDSLLMALDSTSLSAWGERMHAIPNRASSAREAAAKKLEPKAVPVKPAPAVLKSVADVDTYLTALRAQVMVHIDADETVII